MASVQFIKPRRRWRVRWHITDPYTRRIEIGSKVLPRGSTKTEADLFAKKIEDREHDIKLGFRRPNDSMPLALERWFIINRQFSPATQRHYTWTLNRFIERASVRTVDQLSSRHIQDYITFMLAAGRTARAVNSQLTAIKSFCRYAAKYYGLTNAADDITMLREDPPNQRFFTDDEYERAMNFDNPVFHQRFLFIANTGLRASEFCSLQWPNVSQSRDSISIVGKGRKKRTIPLNKICRDILSNLAASNTHIFMSKSEKPLTPNALLLQCYRVAEAINIPKFGPHSFRHWFATSMLLRGVDIAMVSRLLGHASIRTTEKIYIHILPRHFAGLTDCLC